MTTSSSTDHLLTPATGLAIPASEAGSRAARGRTRRSSMHSRLQRVSESSTIGEKSSDTSARLDSALDVRQPALIVPDRVAMRAGRTELDIVLDLTQFDGVKIQGLPAHVRLNRGQQVSESTVLVRGLELVGLEMLDSDRMSEAQDFVLNVTPVRQWSVFTEKSRTINVVYHALPEMIRIPNFGIVSGNSGPFPIENVPESAQVSIALRGLPPNVALSSGTQVGSEWVVGHEDIPGLQIHAIDATETADWSPYFNYLYRAFPVVYAAEIQTDRGSEIHSRTFLMYVFQD